MDGLEWKTLLKWMIWGYPYFRKHPDAKTIPKTPRMTGLHIWTHDMTKTRSVLWWHKHSPSMMRRETTDENIILNAISMFFFLRIGCLFRFFHVSGQIIILHLWNNGISLSQLAFWVRSCEVAIIWPWCIFSHFWGFWTSELFLSARFYADSSNSLFEKKSNTNLERRKSGIWG